MTRKGFMVAATGQHVGKTTTCLGLVSGLLDKGKKVSFLKPVGQSWVEVDQVQEGDKDMKRIKHRVDKDCILFKEKFNLECPYTLMSPVLIPSGYTKAFINGETPSPDELLSRIQHDYNKLAEISDVVVVEGTGHAGVGSIIELNNARVAKALGLKVVLIGTGGIGSAIDTLSLSKAVLEAEGVEIAGVLLNKMQKGKDDIPEYVRKVVEGRWGVPLLGVMGHNKLLSQPTMKDFSMLFKTPLATCEDDALRRIDDVVLIASSVEAFMTQLNKPRQLFVTPSARSDLLFGLIADLKTGGYAGQCGLILTGQPPEHCSAVMERLRKERIPTLILPHTTSVEVVSAIAKHTAKIRFEDDEKIAQAINTVHNGVDFDRLIQAALA